MIQEANDFVEERSRILKQLKETAPYYPIIGRFDKDKRTYLYTFVRIENDGIWYVVLCAEDFRTEEYDKLGMLIMSKLVRSAVKVQNCWAFSDKDEKDTLQISEKERITKAHINFEI